MYNQISFTVGRNISSIAWSIVHAVFIMTHAAVQSTRLGTVSMSIVLFQKILLCLNLLKLGQQQLT